jgi:hypothetical protein
MGVVQVEDVVVGMVGGRGEEESSRESRASSTSIGGDEDGEWVEERREHKSGALACNLKIGHGQVRHVSSDHRSLWHEEALVRLTLVEPGDDVLGKEKDEVTPVKVCAVGTDIQYLPMRVERRDGVGDNDPRVGVEGPHTNEKEGEAGLYGHVK